MSLYNPYGYNPNAYASNNGYNQQPIHQQQFRQQQNFNPQQTQNSPIQLNTYQVTNADEAKAQIVNPIGMTMFLNFAQNEIYVKYIDNNGQGQFLTFKHFQETEQAQQTTGIVPIELASSIDNRLTAIEQVLRGLHNVNAEPIPNNATSTESPTKPASTTRKSKANDSGENGAGASSNSV